MQMWSLQQLPKIALTSTAFYVALNPRLRPTTIGPLYFVLLLGRFIFSRLCGILVKTSIKNFIEVF